MNSNFLSKTVKTFLTSLVISVFVFGSFYFLLSDSGETETITVNDTKKSTPKLVMEEEKDEVLGVTTSNSNNSNSANRDNLIAQIQNEFVAPIAQTTPVSQIVAPTSTVPAVVPTTIPTTQVVTTTTTTRTATGVPTTGNESLYLLMAAFSLISGFLITNGKSLAIRSFEK